MNTESTCRRGRKMAAWYPALQFFLSLALSTAFYPPITWGQTPPANAPGDEPDLSDPRLWPEPTAQPVETRSPGRVRQDKLIAELSEQLPEFRVVRDWRDLVTYLRVSGVDDATFERILREFRYIETLDIGPHGLTEKSVSIMRGMGHLQTLEMELSSAKQIELGALVPLAKLDTVPTIRIHGPKQGMSDPILLIYGLERDSWNGVAAVTLGYQGASILDRVVDEMPHLQRLTLRGCDIPVNSLAALAKLRNLEELDLVASDFTVAGVAMENVSRIKTLQRLGLRLTRIADRDLRRLNQMRALKELNLGNTRVEDEGVEHIVRRSPDLEVLNLSRVGEITDRSARAISRLRRLRELNIDWASITDQGMESLAALPHLESLSLPSTITNRGLEHVAKLPQLRRLDAGGVVQSDEGLALLSGLVKLDQLDISRAKITDAGLEHLAQLTRMRVLSLGDTDIDGSGLKHLLGMRSLQYLNVENTRVQPKHFALLAELTSLRDLILVGSPMGSDEGVPTLAKFPFVQFARVSLNTPPSLELIYEVMPHTSVYSE